MLGLERVSGPNAVVLSLVHLAMMTVCALGIGLLGLFARGRQHAQRGRGRARRRGERSASVR